eukprot:g11182.t1
MLPGSSVGFPSPDEIHSRSKIQTEHAHANQECVLLGKFGSFGWWLQAFLMLTCFVSLVYKRFTDPVRRSWHVWFLDTSKQGVAAFVVHAVNILLSKLFAFLTTAPNSDACNFYWINLMLDCTLGVFVTFLSLKILCKVYTSTRCALWCDTKWFRPEYADIGNYYVPNPNPNANVSVTTTSKLVISHKVWRRQLFDYQLIVIFSKFVVLLFVQVFYPVLLGVASVILGVFNPYPRAKLVFVMVVCPVVMSCIALWVTDNFLQSADRGAAGGASEDARDVVVEGHGSTVRGRGRCDPEDPLRDEASNSNMRQTRPSRRRRKENRRGAQQLNLNLKMISQCKDHPGGDHTWTGGAAKVDEVNGFDFEEHEIDSDDYGESAHQFAIDDSGHSSLDEGGFGDSGGEGDADYVGAGPRNRPDMDPADGLSSPEDHRAARLRPGFAYHATNQLQKVAQPPLRHAPSTNRKVKDLTHNVRPRREIKLKNGVTALGSKLNQASSTVRNYLQDKVLSKSTAGGRKPKHASLRQSDSGSQLASAAAATEVGSLEGMEAAGGFGAALREEDQQEHQLQSPGLSEEGEVEAIQLKDVDAAGGKVALGAVQIGRTRTAVSQQHGNYEPVKMAKKAKGEKAKGGKKKVKETPAQKKAKKKALVKVKKGQVELAELDEQLAKINADLDAAKN